MSDGLTILWVAWWRQKLSSGKPGNVWYRLQHPFFSYRDAMEALEKYIRLPATKTAIEEGYFPYGKPGQPTVWD